MTKNNKRTVLVLLVVALLLVVGPFIAMRGSEFGGSDDAGSQMVSEITGKDYEPWFEPILETAIGGELPGEIESLIFCVQTGIGVGVIAFLMGKFTERKRLETKYPEIKEKEDAEV